MSGPGGRPFRTVDQMGWGRRAALVMAIVIVGSAAACTDPSPPSGEPQIAPCEIADPGRSDFLPPDVTGEIQHTDGSGGLLFDSLESALCEGFERVVVEFDRVVPSSGAPGRLGLAAEWVDEVILDGSGAVQPIGGSEILQLSVLGATWQPGTGSSHSVSGPHDLVAEARFNEEVGGSGRLFLALTERAEYRVFTVDEPYRLVVDVRS